MTETSGHTLQDIKCNQSNKYPTAVHMVKSQNKYCLIGSTPATCEDFDKVCIESSTWNNVKKEVVTLVPLLEVFMKLRKGKRQKTQSILMNDLKSRITKWTTSATKANKGI